MTAEAELTGTAGAIERAVAIVELLANAQEPLRLSDLAHQLGLPKSAAHRALRALIDAGWVEQSAQSDCYGLNLQLALVGQRLLATRRITDLRQPVLDELASKTRELVRLTSAKADTLVWIGSARGRRVGLVYEPDMQEPIIPFATANGKVWLADMPRERAIKIALDAGLGTLELGGRATITSMSELERELEVTRARGYGLAREEAEIGVGAIAVAVRVDSKIVGTLSVAAPIARLDSIRIQQILPPLQRAATSMGLAWVLKRSTGTV